MLDKTPHNDASALFWCILVEMRDFLVLLAVALCQGNASKKSVVGCLQHSRHKNCFISLRWQMNFVQI